MTMHRRLTKFITLLTAIILMMMPLKAYAADGIEIDRTHKNGVVSIRYTDRNGRAIAGMRVRLYRVASVEGRTVAGNANGYELHYTLTDEFKQFDEVTGTTRVTGFSEDVLNNALQIRPGETDGVRTSRWQKIASTIRYYAVTDVAATASDPTLADGSITFTGLMPGLYLLVADGAVVSETDADYRYSYLPTFVALPQYKDGAWDYGATLNFATDDPTLSPKFTYERIEREYQYSIYKRWANDTAQVRPASVQVDIYRNNVFYQTVYLTEANGWQYAWRSTGRYSWYAIERTINPGYSVTITTTGTAITFTNTYTPPPPPPPPPPETPPPEVPPGDPPPPVEGEVPDVLGARRIRGDEPMVLGARRLPRTGQLWWPVPVLAGAGILFLAAGYVRNRRNA